MVEQSVLIDKKHVLKTKNKDVFVKKPNNLKDAFMSYHDLRIKTKKKIKAYSLDTTKQLKTKKKKTSELTKISVEDAIHQLDTYYKSLITEEKIVIPKNPSCRSL